MSPTQHAVDFAPSIVAGLSAITLFLFDQPLAVVVTAVGGAMWGVWRNGALTLPKALLWIFAATVTSLVMVELVVWIISTIFGYNSIPVRALAGLIAFAIVDKPFRTTTLRYIGVKFGDIGVKQ